MARWKNVAYRRWTVDLLFPSHEQVPIHFEENEKREHEAVWNVKIVEGD